MKIERRNFFKSVFGVGLGALFLKIAGRTDAPRTVADGGEIYRVELLAGETVIASCLMVGERGPELVKFRELVGFHKARRGKVKSFPFKA